MWNGFEDVDARNKCGHDESEIVAAGIICHSVNSPPAAPTLIYRSYCRARLLEM